MSKPRAIGYTRVSTAEQVHGYGLAAQENAIREHCREAGIKLLSVVSDEGQSGSNGLDDRLGLAEALARLEAAEADLLVVSRADRLARDLLVQETVIERLRRSGRDVVSVGEPDLTGDDPTRVLVRQVLGAIAQYERGLIRGRLMAGKAVKAARGGYTGGRPAYGRRAENGSLSPNDDEAAVIEAVRAARAEGLSYRAICQRLEQRGYPTRHGGPWRPATVRRIALRSA